MSYRDRPKEVSQEFNKKYYSKSRGNAINSRKPFSEQELLLIHQHNLPDNELSSIIGRSVQSIQIARSRILSGIISVSFYNAT